MFGFMEDRHVKIKENVLRLLRGVPEGIEVVAAAKTRTSDEVIAAVEAGISIIGENYLQEAVSLKPHLPPRVKLHFIGHLQRNKVKKAVEVFDLIETVDSPEMAIEIDKRCREISRTMKVFIEVNSAREANKAGVFPEKAEELVILAASLKNLKVSGLMTMGPLTERVEEIRPFFRQTRDLFDRIKSVNIEGADLRWLSMGMSDSYSIAIEEGANIVRIGTGIFGPRKRG